MTTLLLLTAPKTEESAKNGENGENRSLAADDDRQRADAAQEVGVVPHRLADDLGLELALQHLAPQDLELQLGEAVADAAVDAGAEREVLAHLRALDAERVGLRVHALVAIAGDIPHHHLVALPDGLAGELGVARGGAAHVDDR